MPPITPDPNFPITVPFRRPLFMTDNKVGQKAEDGKSGQCLKVHPATSTKKLITSLGRSCIFGCQTTSSPNSPKKSRLST